MNEDVTGAPADKKRGSMAVHDMISVSVPRGYPPFLPVHEIINKHIGAHVQKARDLDPLPQACSVQQEFDVRVFHQRISE